MTGDGDGIDRHVERLLRYGFLLRPDPCAWLALADLYEEASAYEEALLWRRRGRWFSPLLEGWKETRRRDRDPEFRPPRYWEQTIVPLKDGFEAWYHPSSDFEIADVRIVLPGQPGDTKSHFSPVHFSTWLTRSRQGDVYVVRRVLRLIDDCGEEWDPATSQNDP